MNTESERAISCTAARHIARFRVASTRASFRRAALCLFLATLCLSAPRVLAQNANAQNANAQNANAQNANAQNANAQNANNSAIAASTRDESSRAFLVADAAQEAFVRVAAQLKPSVVNIIAERASAESDIRTIMPPAPQIPTKRGDRKTPATPPQTAPSDDGEYSAQERTTSLGSGMVVRADGFILTNYHVVKDAISLRVVFDFDGERPDRPLARLVGFDEESDLALLKIERDGLLPIEFADSDRVRIGEWAIAIGAPFEQAQSVTIGVVSAKGRHLPDKGRVSLQDFLQTDASINPGNSGGPLIDLQGRVIGINTAILSPSRYNVGIGFAVPSNTIRASLPALFEGKVVARGFLGVNYTRLDADAARELGVPDGVQVGALARDDDGKTIGPAAAAGLQSGDIITAINGAPVDSNEAFRRLVSLVAPGQKLLLDVTRPENSGTRTLQISVTLAPWPRENNDAPKLPASTRESRPVSRCGLEVGDARDLTSTERVLFPFDAKSRGAVIRDVVPGSPADDAQLSRGQMITRARVSGAAWQQISDKNMFRALEKTLAPDTRVLLQLQSSSGLSTYRVIIAPPVEPKRNE